jgi:predicted HTH domain antitoxin
MTTVTVELSDEELAAMRRTPSEYVREMKMAAAIFWYACGQISMEKAARIAGLDRTEFLLELSRRKVDMFNYDAAELAREVGQ